MTAVSRRVPDRVRGIPARVNYLKCDGRGCQSRINGPAYETRRFARDYRGWKVGPPNDYCPDHREDNA